MSYRVARNLDLDLMQSRQPVYDPIGAAIELEKPAIAKVRAKRLERLPVL